MELKPRLLIVEDDDFNQLIYKRFLSKDFSLTACRNDIEFDQALKEDSYDLFLIDLSLAGSKSGLELIAELRQIEKYKTTPVLVVTAHSLKQFEILSMAAGATKFLLKPIENKVLVPQLKELYFSSLCA